MAGGGWQQLQDWLSRRWVKGQVVGGGMEVGRYGSTPLMTTLHGVVLARVTEGSWKGGQGGWEEGRGEETSVPLRSGKPDNWSSMGD